MRSTYILGFASALFGLVSGQATTLPTCAQSCVAQYTTGSNIGGCQNLDIHCICANPNFISGIACCLASACNAADQATAVQYAHDICLTANPPVTVPNAVSCLSTSATSAATSPASSSSASVAASVTSITSSASLNTSTASTASSSVAPSSTTAGTGSSTSSAAAATSKAAGHQNLANSGVSFAGGLAVALALL